MYSYVIYDVHCLKVAGKWKRRWFIHRRDRDPNAVESKQEFMFKYFARKEAILRAKAEWELCKVPAQVLIRDRNNIWREEYSYGVDSSAKG